MALLKGKLLVDEFIAYKQIEIISLRYILKRNDIKKSDAYHSGFLEGTTPAYEAYLRLKKNLAASLK